ncbi:unnamed protein product, partial [Hapterophycus canaliculatus]
QVSCGTCRRNFCFRHRHEEDHKCQAAAEASRREHPNLRKREHIGAGIGGKASRADERSDKITTQAGAGGGGGDGRPCGTQAGEAAARREREARAARGGAGVAAR